jgi:prepilin-type N-terminal cleavage/methylation domain-containing protein
VITQHKKKYRSSPARYRAGFTLIELLVVVVIIGIVSGIAFFNYHGFGESTEVSNIATQIAQGIREAQVNATSVKPSANASSYSNGFGINVVNAANPASYVLFADCNSGSVAKYTASSCTSGGGNQLVQQVTYKTGYKLQGLCGSLNSGALACTSGTLTKANIVFAPATLTALINDGTTLGYTYLEFSIVSPNNSTRKIQVWSNGQVDIQ